MFLSLSPGCRQFTRCTIAVVCAAVLLWPAVATAAEPIITRDGVDYKGLLRAGGVIGYLTIGLSVAMVALIVEHLLTIRRGVLVPRGLAEEIHDCLVKGSLLDAETVCRTRVSFLSYLIAAGLHEAPYGFTAVEKSMEDAAAEQSARLARKIEYLSLIAVIAPMLGLMGTVWGMIQAFGEFALKPNPTTADFAPAISEALVTTLFGLIVAVPAQWAFAVFRNRIDEYVAEASLIAAQTVNPLKKLHPTASKPAAPRSESLRRPTAAGTGSGTPGADRPAAARE